MSEKYESVKVKMKVGGKIHVTKADGVVAQVMVEVGDVVDVDMALYGVLLDSQSAEKYVEEKPVDEKPVEEKKAKKERKKK